MLPPNANTRSAQGSGTHRCMFTVSIILPTYDRLHFLRQSVESVFAQSFTDWQLVVADDGSSEDTTRYLRALESPRVRVLYLTHSGNPSRTRNAALATADGKYVAFLDSDDVWAAMKLETQLAALRGAPQCRWSYSACDRIDAGGNRLPAQAATTTRGGWIFEPLLTFEVTVAMPTLVAERSLIAEVGGFDEAQLYGEFHDLALRLALRSEALAIADVLCSIRVHDKHYSADRAAAHRAWMRLYEKFRELAPTAEGRSRCDRMRSRAALNLAALHGAQRDFPRVWSVLREGKAWSWRRPSSWGSYWLALLRPLLPSASKPSRAPSARERVMHRLWRTRVRAGEIQQQLAALFQPSRLRYIAHSWPLRPDVCPCDVHFCDYLDERGIRGRAIFHFGSGGHHVVGTRNHTAGWQNEVLSLTLAPAEHARYLRRVVRDPAFGRYYKVLFADIYSLCADGLPLFDLVSLFHLCEFGDASSGGRRHDDEGVLRTFCSRLRADGLLLLYRGSFGFKRAEPLVARAVADGTLSFVEDYKSLSIYRRVLPPDVPGVGS